MISDTSRGDDRLRSPRAQVAGFNITIGYLTVWLPRHSTY
jgi:hypothetical protein